MNNRQLTDNEESNQRMMKEEYYDNLKAMMERGEIQLLNDDNIKRSLESVQMELVKEGYLSNVKIFSNPHNESDIAEAIIRAAWLAKHEKAYNFKIHYV